MGNGLWGLEGRGNCPFSALSWHRSSIVGVVIAVVLFGWTQLAFTAVARRWQDGLAGCRSSLRFGGWESATAKATSSAEGAGRDVRVAIVGMGKAILLFG